MTPLIDRCESTIYWVSRQGSLAIVVLWGEIGDIMIELELPVMRVFKALTLRPDRVDVWLILAYLMFGY